MRSACACASRCTRRRLRKAAGRGAARVVDGRIPFRTRNVSTRTSLFQTRRHSPRRISHSSRARRHGDLREPPRMVPRASEKGQAAVAVVGVSLLLVLAAVGAGVLLRASLTRQRAAGTADGAALAAAAVLRDRAGELRPSLRPARARRAAPAPDARRARRAGPGRRRARRAVGRSGARLAAHERRRARAASVRERDDPRLDPDASALARSLDPRVAAHRPRTCGARLSGACARARLASGRSTSAASQAAPP